MEKTFLEYFANDQWISTTYLLLYNHDRFFCLSHRKTEIYYDGSELIIYYQGWAQHRLDGPAVTMIDYAIEHWHVTGVYLESFRPGTNDIITYLFEYSSKYPQFLKYIKRISIHNKWLDEEKLLLLNTLAVSI